MRLLPTGARQPSGAQWGSSPSPGSADGQTSRARGRWALCSRRLEDTETDEYVTASLMNATQTSPFLLASSPARRLLQPHSSSSCCFGSAAVSPAPAPRQAGSAESRAPESREAPSEGVPVGPPLCRGFSAWDVSAEPPCSPDGRPERGGGPEEAREAGASTSCLVVLLVVRESQTPGGGVLGELFLPLHLERGLCHAQVVLQTHRSVRVSVCACMRACVRACVRA